MVKELDDLFGVSAKLIAARVARPFSRGGRAFYCACGLGDVPSRADSSLIDRHRVSLSLGDIWIITLETLEGEVVLFANVPAGVTLGQMGVRVNATGTTATSLVGMY